MFGTALATSTLMASNFIGTRVFTLGVYTNTFAKDFTFSQNHVVSSAELKLDPVTVQSTTISQNHKMDDVPLVAQSFVESPVFRQNQLLVPLGQYLTTFVASNSSFKQNHKVSGTPLKFNIFTQPVTFRQNHAINPTDLLSLSIVPTGVMIQRHILVSIGQYLTTSAAPNSSLKQNHKVYGDNLKLDAFAPTTVFRQNHVINPDDLLSLSNVPTGTIKQSHILVSLGQYSTTNIPTAVFGQNHIMNGTQLTTELYAPTDPVFRQNHLFIPDYLKVEPFQVGKPFVNPSVRRSVIYTGDSTNVMTVSIDEENFAIISNGDKENFVVISSSDKNNSALILDLATNKYT